MQSLLPERQGAELARQFDADISPERGRLPPPELFPKRESWVVRKENGDRVLNVMTWGFPPPPKSRAPVTNVRNLSSPFWRSALNRPDRRCLVPATEFCEWEGEAGSKRERWFSLPACTVFAFAGIWRPVEEGRAFAMLTCEPNPLVAPIHAKAMPVTTPVPSHRVTGRSLSALVSARPLSRPCGALRSILHPEDYDRWLDGAVEDACSLAQPFPSQLMAVA